MNSLAILLLNIIQIYIYVVVAAIVVSWLINFNVLNTGNKFVYTVNDFLGRLTEPVLRPMRRYIPVLGGIDVTPVVLILLLVFLQNLIAEYWFRIFG